MARFSLESGAARRLPLELAGATLAWGLLLWAFSGALNQPPPVPEPAPVEERLVIIPTPAPTPPPPKPTPPPKPKPTPPPTRHPERPRARPIVPTVPHVALPQHVAHVTPKTHETVPIAPTAAPGTPAPPVRSPGGGRMGARAIYRPLPEFPEELRDNPLSTEVVASFRVAPDGSATVELSKAASDPRLNRFLLGVLRTWRFFPAVEDGKPTASILEIRIPVAIH